ncbi:hypothetical protein BC332_31334 [Capsicum chinense]|nr:hypothetical protein BC332_31334 [Capsicum chinense]
MEKKRVLAPMPLSVVTPLAVPVQTGLALGFKMPNVNAGVGDMKWKDAFGGFSTVDAISGVAKSNSARVLLLTAHPDSGSSVKYASVVTHIPAQTMADKEKEGALLPIGSLYEGATFVLFEMVVYKLAQVLKQSPETVRARHTNLD